jgi:hypothetical protein
MVQAAESLARKKGFLKKSVNAIQDLFIEELHI